MSLARRIYFTWRYWRGNVPWDSGIVPPEVTAWIERRESDGLPAGRALDLGCGTGTTALYLADHGWQVVGVDFAPNAIRRARRKAGRLKDRVSFRVADVTRPDFLADEAPFDLVVDIGCLHGLESTQQVITARHVIRLTRPGATVLIYGFRSQGAGGIDAAGLEALFGPAFELVDYTVGQDTARLVPSGWYTVRRMDCNR
jgi:SAM-dependent methyltransferase